MDDMQDDHGKYFCERFKLLPTYDAKRQFISIDKLGLKSLGAYWWKKVIKQSKEEKEIELKKKIEERTMDAVPPPKKKRKTKLSEKEKEAKRREKEEKRKLRQEIEEEIKLRELKEKERIEKATSSLDNFFDRKKGISKATIKNKSLCPMIRTNGIELHIMFEKNVERMRTGARKHLKAGQKIRPADLDPSYEVADIGMVKYEDIIGVDPGTNTPYSAGRPTKKTMRNGNIIFEKRTVTLAGYNKRSKRKKVNKRAERDRKRFKMVEVYDELAVSGSLKGCEYESIVTAVQLRLRHQEAMHKCQSNRQKLKLKFEARIAQRKEMDRIIDFVKWGKGEGAAKVIFWGDGSKMHGIKGCSTSVPNRRIKRHTVKRGRNEGFSSSMLMRAILQKDRPVVRALV